MKNPNPVLDNPSGGSTFGARHPFVVANYNVLLEATSGEDDKTRLDVDDPADMEKYLNAGFALSDIYCDQYFRDAEESQRRRKYGRAITNDVGTAISTLLGLANAGQDVVTASAAAFGFGDSLWRNYDEAFVVAPDLSNVKALVTATQDAFRKSTFLGGDEGLPSDYGKAQTVILRYADLCSTLGMQAMLNQSAGAQRQELRDYVEGSAPTPTPTPIPTPTPTPTPAAPAPEAAPLRVP